MKLTAFFILAACLHVNATGYGQKVTLSERAVHLEKIFAEIRKQTGYSFLYTSHVLKNTSKVTVTVTNAPVNEVLDIALQGQGLEYRIKNEDNLIVIKPKAAVVEKVVQVVGDPIDVSGKVTDGEGRPLPGANVQVRGTGIGVRTDNNGNFVLKNVSENAILEISFVGHEMKTFTARKTGFFTIALGQKLSTLDETVVIGYGTTSRRFTTGNVSTIKAKEIEMQPVQNPLLTLQGRVTGVEVTQLTGLPGGGVRVRIQGRNSLQSGLEPLIVIDGIPFPSQLSYSNNIEGLVQNGSPLNYINPDDIESIDVLKDADATAIYGSRAANGAILITTKKGRIGRSKISVNCQHGFGKVGRRVEMMNTQQYLEMRREAFRNSSQIPSANPTSMNPFVYAPDLLFWDTTRYTDWQKELIGGSAQYTNLNASVSGGTSTVQYLVGGTFNRQTTVFPGEFDNKVGGLHLNINASSVNQRIRLQLTGSYSHNDNHLPGVDLTSRSLLMEPNAPPLFDEDGELNWAQNGIGNSTWTNPLTYVKNTDFFNTTKNMLSNLNLSYRILPGLNISSNFGYTNMQTTLYYPQRLELVKPELRANAQRTAIFANRNMGSWIVEPQLQYDVKMGVSKIVALLGSTVQKSSFDFLSVTGSGFSTDLLMKTLKAATAVNTEVSSSGITRFNSLFGRVNYNYNDKYLVNFSIRRDGSNKFGDENKFHSFWSVGAGWIFSEEKWLHKQLPFLSFGKLRASYGTTGSDQITDFAYLSRYTISNPTVLYQSNIGLNVQNISNPSLQWEETRKYQGGIDLGFLNDRILIGFTYALNRSSNQLVSYNLPSITGFTFVTKNLQALIQNTSFEFTINTVNIKRNNFNWTSNLNLTIPKNKLVSFPGIELTGYASGTTGVIIGQPVGVKRIDDFAGVNLVNGAYMVFDKNGNPNSSVGSQNILLSPFSEYYGGISNSISVMGFQIDFLIQFVRKKGINDMYYYNGVNYPGEFSASFSNQPVSILDRWQKPGDIAPIGIYLTSNSFGLTPLLNSVAWYSYDASYIRLKNVSLSWQVPVKWIKQVHLQNARFYIHSQNLATVTNYRGLDPETMSNSSLPPLRMWTAGVQLAL